LAHSHDNGTLARITLKYTDHHHFLLPEGHKFPLLKYRMLRQLLQAEDVFALEAADLASREAVLRVHGREYVDRFLDGTLDKQVMRHIGFPWSPELVMRTLASAGATLGATRLAIKLGFGGTLAGGTHHAFRDHGAGFCVFNDLAIAIEWARAQCGIERAAVVDLDVHQGDGTASIFEGDRGIFTLSLHGARNFPLHKQKSSLDVELPDGTDDCSYLAALEPALAEVWKFSPQLMLYQAGVDGLQSDRLGRLALTLDGLRQRDLAVIGGAHSRKIPLVVTIGGGYANPIEDTVRASAQTFLTAEQIYRSDVSMRLPFQPKSLPEL
jgi:acetoin utilization deacetylase AcuC-like enzyme